MTNEFLKEVATKIATLVGEETMIAEATNAAVMSLLDILVEEDLLNAPVPPGLTDASERIPRRYQHRQRLSENRS